MFHSCLSLRKRFPFRERVRVVLSPFFERPWSLRAVRYDSWTSTAKISSQNNILEILGDDDSYANDNSMKQWCYWLKPENCTCCTYSAPFSTFLCRIRHVKSTWNHPFRVLTTTWAYNSEMFILFLFFFQLKYTSPFLYKVDIKRAQVISWSDVFVVVGVVVS